MYVYIYKYTLDIVLKQMVKHLTVINNHLHSDGTTFLKFTYESVGTQNVLKDRFHWDSEATQSRLTSVSMHEML